MSSLFGIQIPSFLSFIISLAFVLLLLYAVLYTARHFGILQSTTPRVGRAKMNRLSITEVMIIDGRRKMLLVKRDDVEHLIMIGGPQDVCVETSIKINSQNSALDELGKLIATPKVTATSKVHSHDITDDNFKISSWRIPVVQGETPQVVVKNITKNDPVASAIEKPNLMALRRSLNEEPPQMEVSSQKIDVNLADSKALKTQTHQEQLASDIETTVAAKADKIIDTEQTIAKKIEMLDNEPIDFTKIDSALNEAKNNDKHDPFDTFLDVIGMSSKNHINENSNTSVSKNLVSQGEIENFSETLNDIKIQSKIETDSDNSANKTTEKNNFVVKSSNTALEKAKEAVISAVNAAKQSSNTAIENLKANKLKFKAAKQSVSSEQALLEKQAKIFQDISENIPKNLAEALKAAMMQDPVQMDETDVSEKVKPSVAFSALSIDAKLQDQLNIIADTQLLNSAVDVSPVMSHLPEQIANTNEPQVEASTEKKQARSHSTKIENAFTAIFGVSSNDETHIVKVNQEAIEQMLDNQSYKSLINDETNELKQSKNAAKSKLNDKKANFDELEQELTRILMEPKV